MFIDLYGTVAELRWDDTRGCGWLNDGTNRRMLTGSEYQWYRYTFQQIR